MSKRPVPSHRTRRVAASPAAAGFRPAVGALAVAAAFSLHAPAVFAQPAGAQAIHGTATLNRNGNNLVVTTTNGAGTNHSAINWQSFSVPGGSVTQFNQPSASSLSVNRVVGNDPSKIFGTLSSNGRLVLVNPAGITVGAGAVVDTAGFTASTLRMKEADAIAGRLVFGDGGAGVLQVDGRILARNGDVVLIGSTVQTGADAVIQSENGATILAAGQKAELTGRGLEGIRLEVQAGDSALNLGSLKGDAVGIFADTLKHSGLVQANAVATEGGKVVLKAVGGDALVDGTVTASSASGKGGSIDVLGNRVGLLAGASVDASGAAGGGSVRIGGDYQGKNAEVPNAQRTYVDPQATVRADATAQGDGGRIIVWADHTTQGNGTISARGGPEGGDGGFVEVSGKRNLEFAAKVDTSAPKGKLGTLLLDPDYIVIDSAMASSLTGSSTDVSLQANYDITVASDGAMTFTTSGQSFTAVADGDITVEAPITTTAGNVTLYAGQSVAGTAGSSSGSLTVNASITTNGGNIDLQAEKYPNGWASVGIYNSSVNAGSGTVTIRGQSNVEFSDASISGSSVQIANTGTYGWVDVFGSTINATAGGVSIGAGGGEWIGGGVEIYSGSNITSTGGGISIDAPFIYVNGGATLDSGSSALNLNSVSMASVGGSLRGGSIDVRATEGNVRINTSMAPAGGLLSGGSINISATKGKVQIDSGVEIEAAGSVTIAGDARDSWYSYMPGVEIGDATITGSTINITGYSDQGWGVVMWGDVALNAPSNGAVTGTVESVGSGGGGILLDYGASLTGNGSMTLIGATAEGSGHVPVSLYNAEINRSGGTLFVSGLGDGPYGIEVRDSSISTSGTLNLTGTADVHGVFVDNSTLTSTGGNVVINATATGAEAYGFRMTSSGGDTINATAGSIQITGQVDPGAGAAISLDNETLNALTGITLNTVDGGIALYGTTLAVTGTDGEIKLRAAPATTSPTAPPNAPAILVDGGSLSAGNSNSLDAVRFEADVVEVNGAAITTGSTGGRTAFVPVSSERLITLGGSDETNRLNLTQDELNNITTSTIVVGSSTMGGGIQVEGATPITVSNASALSLIQPSAATISQLAGLVVNSLNADAGQVYLNDPGNVVSVLSGKATNGSGGGFQFTSYNPLGLTIGTVDMQGGILAAGTPVILGTSGSGGSISQSEEITANGLSVNTMGGAITLTHPENAISGYLSAQTAPAGSINIVNSDTGPSSFSASSGGTIAYKAAGSITLESVFTSSGATGNEFGTAAISIEAASMTPTPPPPSAAPTAALNTPSGSVYLKATGDIGSSGNPVGFMAPGGITVAGGNDVHLSTATPFTTVHDLVTTGNVTLQGPSGAFMLDLRAAAVGGALEWTNYASASLGSGGGLVAATGPITSSGNVYVKGMLAPGGVGGISTMQVNGNLDVMSGATLKFDFDSGGGHDVINVTGNTTFASPDGSTSVVTGGSQPPNNAYTLISGTTSGGLPAVSGSISGVTLAFGSLIAQVSAAPTSPPASSPPASSAPTMAPTSPPASSAPPPAPTDGPTSAPTPPPTSSPTQPPTPAPTTAPAPSTSEQQQMDSHAVTFAKLFMEEVKAKEEEEKGIGKEDIVITDTSCAPGQ